MKRLRRIFSVTIGWLLLALAYFAASSTVADPVLLPDLTELARATVNLVWQLEVWQHLGATLREAGVAVLFSVVIGVPVGLGVGASFSLRAALEPPIDWLRSVPATALFPVMLLFFGLGAETRIAIATYGSAFPVVIATLYGAVAVDQDRVQHARRCGIGAPGRIIHVIAWDALPSILAGVRLAISASLVLIVVGEMFIGAQEGAGFLIVFYQTRFQTAQMFGVIVILGLLGYVLNWAFQRLEAGARHTQAGRVSG